MTLQTITLNELARIHVHLGVAKPNVSVAAPAESFPPTGLTVINPIGDGVALQIVNDARMTVAALGCAFVRDVAICGSSYVFHGDALLTDGSHLSQVAEQWVGQPMPDSPVARAPAAQRTVDGLCILATGPGHLIYGHWLVDFVPRVMIARAALGKAFASAKLALPHDTPRWALTMLQTFAGVDLEQCVFFERGVERLAIGEACIPSYGHTDYFFHPFCNEVFDRVGQPAQGSGRKLCISRAAFEGQTHGVQKLLADRARFESMAVAEGYEIVQPETLPFMDQVSLFRSATRIVGEYGSGLHSSVFSPPGTKVGFIRCPNQIQMRIGALRQQDSVVVRPTDDRVAENGVQVYSMEDEDVAAFFQAMR